MPKETIAVNEFHDGRARIILESPKEPPFHSTYGEGYIDETGEIVIGPKPYKAHDFSNGLAMVEDSNSLAYRSRGEGSYHAEQCPDQDSPPSYKTSAKDFQEGLAAVRFQEQDDKFARRWGYIDQTGKLAIKCEYEFADDFSEGLAGVEFHGKYGFINTKGEMVIPPSLENRWSVDGDIAVQASAGRFKEGLARVMVNRLFGYIDKTGKLIIQAQFQRAQDFSDGLAGL